MTGTLSNSTFDQQPVIHFLLLCVSPQSSDQTSQQMQTLSTKSLDWQSLIELARKHRVLALLHRRLEAVFLDSIPKSLFSELHSYCHRVSIRNLFMTAELSKLLSLMNSKGIDAMPYKGPVLSESLYCNLHLRQFGDLDIVIQPQDMPAVEQLLSAEGYQPYFGSKTAAELESYMADKSQHTYDFYHEKKQIFIEVHWRFWPVFFSSVHPQDIWHRREQMSFAGKTVSTLRPEDQLIILCMHGSRHRWERLSWLCDIAMLLEKYPELNWDEVSAIAREWGAQRMLYLGLYLAHTLLSANFPESVSQKIKADSAIVQLAQKVNEQLFSSNLPKRFLASTRYQIQVRERWQDKALCAQALIRWLLRGCP
ncbi:MAG: nucleotidyltransferase family protein [Cyanobacteria bacterium J06631_9]